MAVGLKGAGAHCGAASGLLSCKDLSWDAQASNCPSQLHNYQGIQIWSWVGPKGQVRGVQLGQGLGLPHKGSLGAGWAVEAWFGTSTVASLSQPSGVGESSGNKGSGVTLTVQRRDVAWGPKTCGALLWDPPTPRLRLLSLAAQVLQ